MSPLRAIAVAVALSGIAVAGHAAEPAQIATKAGCAACHAVDKKMIGPSYRDIAARYKGRADAVALLSEHVRKGSKDAWGKVPMPASDAAKIGDADLKAVITWVLKTPT